MRFKFASKTHKNTKQNWPNLSNALYDDRTKSIDSMWNALTQNVLYRNHNHLVELQLFIRPL